jgi:hypothetical protein
MHIAKLAAVLVATTLTRAADNELPFHPPRTPTATSIAVPADQVMPLDERTRLMAMAKPDVAKLAVFTLLVAATVAHAGEGEPSFRAFKTSTLTSIVTAIDQTTRMVTLVNEDGELTIKADKRVKNLKQVKRGDVVTATVTESINARVLKPADAVLPRARQMGSNRNEASLLATIQGIDKSNRIITLRGPDGNAYPIQAADKRNVERLATGDNLEIRATQAMAIEVTSAR